jgi:hypothetical protein
MYTQKRTISIDSNHSDDLHNFSISHNSTIPIGMNMNKETSKISPVKSSRSILAKSWNFLGGSKITLPISAGVQPDNKKNIDVIIIENKNGNESMNEDMKSLEIRNTWRDSDVTNNDVHGSDIDHVETLNSISKSQNSDSLTLKTSLFSNDSQDNDDRKLNLSSKSDSSNISNSTTKPIVSRLSPRKSSIGSSISNTLFRSTSGRFSSPHSQVRKENRSMDSPEISLRRKIFGNREKSMDSNDSGSDDHILSNGNLSSKFKPIKNDNMNNYNPVVVSTNNSNSDSDSPDDIQISRENIAQSSSRENKSTSKPKESSLQVDFDRDLFYSFEFKDLSPEERKMYIDRADTHNFKVRGPNYLKDGNKIEAGPALCKLMLMELYEVEPKVYFVFHLKNHNFIFNSINK